mgnify:CR=1 FL=1
MKLVLGEKTLWQLKSRDLRFIFLPQNFRYSRMFVDATSNSEPWIAANAVTAYIVVARA